MKRFHACCSSHATRHFANRIFRSLALGSVGTFELLFRFHGSRFFPTLCRCAALGSKRYNRIETVEALLQWANNFRDKL